MLQQNLPPNYSMSQHLELCKSNHSLHRQKSGYEAFLRHRPIFCKVFQFFCGPAGSSSGLHLTIGYQNGGPSSLQTANNAYVAQSPNQLSALLQAVVQHSRLSALSKTPSLPTLTRPLPLHHPARLPYPPHRTANRHYQTNLIAMFSGRFRQSSAASSVVHSVIFATGLFLRSTFRIRTT